MTNERLLPTNQSSDLPTFTVIADGNQLSGTDNLVGVTVIKQVNKIALARLIFKDGDAASEDFPLSNGENLIPGKEIEITAGYHNEEETIFKGLIIKQSIRVKNSKNSYLVVECKDKSYRLSIGRQSRYFTDSTDSEALEEILNSYDLEVDVESTEVSHRHLVQYHSSDWDFMVSRAELNGKLVFVDDGKITITQPDFSLDSVATLTYGANLLSLDATLDATDQPETIICKAWDLANQENLEIEATPASIEEAGNIASSELSGLVSEDSRQYQHTGYRPSEELQAWADAQKLKNSLAKIQGSLTCQGLPQVKPGNILELAGVGDRFNGKVFVSGIRHEFSHGEWNLHIQFGWSAELFTKENETKEMPAAGLLAAVNGLQIGIVSQLQDDPDGEDRVLVKMPLVDAEAEGSWARVACLDAGENRGSFFRPEIGDEVVLGFLNDDPRDPIILGMLNSSNKPAPVTASDDNPEKGFYTREELKLVFNDEVKSIQLETPNGNIITLSEENGGILIKDENNNKIEMTSDGIVIESAGDLTLTATGDLTLEGSNVEASATGNFKAEGSGGAKLSSSSTTEIKGSLVNIN